MYIHVGLMAESAYEGSKSSMRQYSCTQKMVLDRLLIRETKEASAFAVRSSGRQNI